MRSKKQSRKTGLLGETGWADERDGKLWEVTARKKQEARDVQVEDGKESPLKKVTRRKSGGVHLSKGPGCGPGPLTGSSPCGLLGSRAVSERSPRPDLSEVHSQCLMDDDK